jgi:hypothetical protein
LGRVSQEVAALRDFGLAHVSKGSISTAAQALGERVHNLQPAPWTDIFFARAIIGNPTFDE